MGEGAKINGKQLALLDRLLIPVGGQINFRAQDMKEDTTERVRSRVFQSLHDRFTARSPARLREKPGVHTHNVAVPGGDVVRTFGCHERLIHEAFGLIGFQENEDRSEVARIHVERLLHFLNRFVIATGVDEMTRQDGAKRDIQRILLHGQLHLGD